MLNKKIGTELIISLTEKTYSNLDEKSVSQSQEGLCKQTGIRFVQEFYGILFSLSNARLQKNDCF